MNRVRTFFLCIMLVGMSLILCSCGSGFGVPKYGKLESMTVQEYANGEPVSREVTCDIEDDIEYRANDSAMYEWGDIFSKYHNFRKTNDKGFAQSTQALLYRLKTTDGEEISFFVYMNPEGTASYFEKPDGEVWKDTGEFGADPFTGGYSSYQHLSFNDAFEEAAVDGDYQLLPGYNGRGKALLVTDDTAIAEDPNDTDRNIRIEVDQIYWEGWDGTGSLELPVYDDIFFRKDHEYLANRAEDVRYIIRINAIGQDINGYWVDSQGNHLSNSYTTYHTYELCDLVTGERILFEDGSTAPVEVKNYIDGANGK